MPFFLPVHLKAVTFKGEGTEGLFQGLEGKARIEESPHKHVAADT